MSAELLLRGRTAGNVLANPVFLRAIELFNLCASTLRYGAKIDVCRDPVVAIHNAESVWFSEKCWRGGECSMFAEILCRVQKPFFCFRAAFEEKLGIKRACGRRLDSCPDGDDRNDILQ